MQRRPLRDAGAIGLLAAIGLVPLAFHLRFLSEATGLSAVVTGALVPIVCSGLVVGATIPIARSSLSPTYTLRITGWSALGAVTLGAVALLFVIHETSLGPPPAAPLVVIGGATSVGSVFGLAFGLTDAQQQRTQDQLERSNAQLTVLNRVLRHNIRNATTVIRGRVKLLRQRADGGEESAAIVDEHVDRLLSVSDHARHIDAVTGSAGPEDHGSAEEVVDLVEVVEGAIERLRTEHPAADFDGPAAATCRVRAHPLAGVVATELLENAVVHNDADAPRVDAAVIRIDGGAALRVADNGSGIPEETVETIRRGYETPMRHADGLGLWLVRWVVDRSSAELAFDADEAGQVVRIQFETVESAAGLPTAPASDASLGAQNASDDLDARGDTQSDARGDTQSDTGF